MMHRHRPQVNDPPLPQLLPADESEPEKKKVVKVSFPDIEEWIMDVDIICTGQDQLGDSDIAQKEVDRYLSSIVTIQGFVTILAWWKEHEMFYPHIPMVAKKYLAIPASSVASEPVFSFTGNLVNKKRTRMSPDTVKTMVFLNKNMQYYW